MPAFPISSGMIMLLLIPLLQGSQGPRSLPLSSLLLLLIWVFRLLFKPLGLQRQWGFLPSSSRRPGVNDASSLSWYLL